jgi:ketopantoate reductase
MRIGVVGAGAVGAYFGAKLAAAGHDLAFIARGEHLGAMTQQGCASSVRMEICTLGAPFFPLIPLMRASST